MALVEAAAAGLLCVSTAVGGVPEVHVPCRCPPLSSLQRFSTASCPPLFPRLQHRIELGDQCIECMDVVMQLQDWGKHQNRLDLQEVVSISAAAPIALLLDVSSWRAGRCCRRACCCLRSPAPLRCC